MTYRRAWIALATIIILLTSFSTASAQADYRVVKVEVEGNRVASKSLILGVSSIAVGSPLTPQLTTETIRRLYGLGIFSDVRIEVEEVTGGIAVYLVVEELPKLSGLEFEGNEKADDKDLKEELRLGVGGYISPYLIEQKKQNIKNYYAEKGYFQAVVTPSLTYNADSTEAILRYTINEKSKVKVEKVVLTGNEEVPDGDIIGKMRNRKRGFLRSSDFAQDEYDEDLEKIITEFHKKGYIDAYLKSDSMTIDTTRNRMTIYLDVYEGPRYYFGKTEFVNNKELPSKYLEDKMKYDEWDVFNLEKYEESMQELYSAYYDIGHLHIRLIDERATRSDSLIDIKIDITEGLPSHINLVKIVGNRKTKDHVIRREITAFPGYKFNRELLIRSVRDVMALNYFSNVNPVPVDLPNGDVDLEFQVEEKQTGQVSAGAGYNSQDKVVGNVGMGIPNFRGMGQSLNFNIEFGSNRNSYSVSFTEPYLFGRPTLFGIDLYSIKRNWFDDYDESRQGFSIKTGKRLRWPDNYFRVYASYRLERDRYNNFDDNFIDDNSFKNLHVYPIRDSDGNIVFSETTGDTLYSFYTQALDPYPGSILEYDEAWNTASRIALSISRDSRNLPEFTTSGANISYTFEKTGGFLGGYWNYTKHTVSAAKFFPLFWNIAFAAKFEFGGIVTPSGSNDKLILLSDRYTPGGTAYDGIVRGYDDGSLTPDSTVHIETPNYLYLYDTVAVNENGGLAYDTTVSITEYTTRVRGNYMLIGNFEIQIPIVRQQIYALMFFDAGNSYRRFKDIKPFTNLYSSVGVGFRIAVPGIGTLGFDFGNPLDNRLGNDNGWHSHFQIGTTFR